MQLEAENTQLQYQVTHLEKARAHELQTKAQIEQDLHTLQTLQQQTQEKNSRAHHLMQRLMVIANHYYLRDCQTRQSIDEISSLAQRLRKP